MLVLGVDPGASTGLVLANYYHEHRCSAVRWCRTVRDFQDVVSAMIEAREAGARVVAVETVAGYAWGPRASARVGQLVAAARQVGEIVGVAKSIGLGTVEATSRKWRRAVVGKSAVKDRFISDVFTERGYPLPRCNAHARDAYGVALYVSAGLTLGLFEVER